MDNNHNVEHGHARNREGQFVHYETLPGAESQLLLAQASDETFSDVFEAVSMDFPVYVSDEVERAFQALGEHELRSMNSVDRPVGAVVSKQISTASTLLAVQLEALVEDYLDELEMHGAAEHLGVSQVAMVENDR